MLLSHKVYFNWQVIKLTNKIEQISKSKNFWSYAISIIPTLLIRDQSILYFVNMIPMLLKYQTWNNNDPKMPIIYSCVQKYSGLTDSTNCQTTLCFCIVEIELWVQKWNVLINISLPFRVNVDTKLVFLILTFYCSV